MKQLLEKLLISVFCAVLSAGCGSDEPEAEVTAPIEIQVNEIETNCTPGYEPCLPPAADYDCQGGSGNGPFYTGPVRVLGPDIYRLDRDGDGFAC